MRRWRSRIERYSRRGSCGHWCRSTRAKLHPRSSRTAPECSLTRTLRGQNRHRVSVVDLLPIHLHGDPKSIVYGRGLEHLDDLDVVARIGERARKQARDLAAELVGGHSRRRQTDLREECLELAQKQITRMRRVA